MNRIKRALRFILCKILGLPYRPPLSEWEVANINSHDARFYVCIDKNGLFNIRPGGADVPLEYSAGRSLAYFLGREILDFAEVIEGRLKQLDQSNVPHRTPKLDAILRETENENEEKEN